VKSTQIWPDLLYIVRHGESAGNVARDAALKAGEPVIDLEFRDVDVPLSDLGKRQSIALGRWFGALPAEQRPNIVLTSPYLRARHSAGLIVKTAEMAADSYSLIVDERFREKEFGILDRLTAVGVKNQYPEQAEFRRLLGKFYHRPPGGESWCDVILRLRSVLDTISLHYAGQRVLVVAHQVVVLCLRYILEHLDEAQILAIDAEGDVANCSVTEYRFDPDAGKHGALVLARYNDPTAIDDVVPVTRAKDPPAGVRG